LKRPEKGHRGDQQHNIIHNVDTCQNVGCNLLVRATARDGVIPVLRNWPARNDAEQKADGTEDGEIDYQAQEELVGPTPGEYAFALEENRELDRELRDHIYDDGDVEGFEKVA
jgi:hypothetical protein